MELTNLETITHIAMEGNSHKYVTSFDVKYYTALDTDVAEWKQLTMVRDYIINCNLGQDSREV
jgi:hypothetical protein